MNAMQRHLVTLAMLEGAIVVAAAVRLVLGLVDLERQAHLVWFVGVVVLAGLPIAFYVVRSTMLRAQGAETGVDLGTLRRQALITAVALMIPAAVIAAAGPPIVERLLGPR